LKLSSEVMACPWTVGRGARTPFRGIMLPKAASARDAFRLFLNHRPVWLIRSFCALCHISAI
jgi:hypothetical protein